MSDDTSSPDYSITDASDESDDTLMGDDDGPAVPLENHPRPAPMQKNPTPAPPVKRFAPTPAYPHRSRLTFLGGCPRVEWEKVVRHSDTLFDVVVHNPLEFLVFLSDYLSCDVLERMGRVVFWIGRLPRRQHVPARFEVGGAGVVGYWPGDFGFATLEYAWPVPTLSGLKRGWDGLRGGSSRLEGPREEDPGDVCVELLARQWGLVVDEFLDNGSVPKGDFEVFFDLGDGREGGDGEHPLMRHGPFLGKLERMGVDVGARPFKSLCDCSEGCLGFLVLRRLEWRGKMPRRSA